MKKSALKGLAGLALGAMMALDGSAPVFAMPLANIGSGFAGDNGIVPVVVGCGAHGCARRYPVRRPVHGAVVVRPGWHGHGVQWVRPYRWPPGRAIAYGAAIGFVAAATAAAYAPPPPQPGLCWYYTDPSRTNGFWDVCP